MNPQDSASRRFSRTLILNSLRDIHGGPSILGNDKSRKILDSQYRETIPKTKRGKFRSGIRSIQKNLADEKASLIESVVNDMVENMNSNDIYVEIIHKTWFSVEKEEVGMYNFLSAQNHSDLTSLPLSAENQKQISNGIAELANNNLDTALNYFGLCIKEDNKPAEDIIAYLLSGYTHCKRGEKIKALDYVKKSLRLNSSSLAAKMIGYAVDSEFSDEICQDKLDVCLFFRWSSTVPTYNSISIEVEKETNEAYPLQGSDECKPIKSISENTGVNISISGKLGKISPVGNYYVGFGVVDRGSYEVRAVEDVILSGPTRSTADEIINFYFPEPSK